MRAWIPRFQIKKTKRSVLFWGLTNTVIIGASSCKETNINPSFFTSVNIEIIPLLFIVGQVGLFATEHWTTATNLTMLP